MPEFTGKPPDVTVITAEAAENCGTLAEGTKLSVVTVGDGGPANIVALVKSMSAAGPPKIDIIRFIKNPPDFVYRLSQGNLKLKKERGNEARESVPVLPPLVLG